MSEEIAYKQAKQILIDNDKGRYTVPTKNLYPYQWNWDSLFVALGFSTFSEDRAWLEIETLFNEQWGNGFVPHIIFHEKNTDYFPGPEVWQTNRVPATSGISNPPVAASILLELWNHTNQEEKLPRLRKLFPKILNQHRWFHQYRDPLDKGLVMTVHPWETGRDNSPEWDEAATRIDTESVGRYTRCDVNYVNQNMRPSDEEYDRYIALVQYGLSCQWEPVQIAQHSPFRVIDVLMSMVLLRANRDLMKLAEFLNETLVVNELGQQIEKSAAGIDYLWDPTINAFCSRDPGNGNFSGYITSASFLAAYAGVGSTEQHQHLNKHLQRIATKVSFLLPSLDPDSPAFDAICYWRGPVWFVVNYMVAKGLAEFGFRQWADKIYHDTLSLGLGTGFYESFCPLSGQGTGGRHFSWTAAIFLYIQHLTADD